MKTKDYSETVKTSLIVTIYAYTASGGVGIFGIWLGQKIVDIQNVSGILSPVVVINMAVTGAALGASFVGLCGLILGAKLGRRFSYPLAISVAGFLGPLAFAVLTLYGLMPRKDLFVIIWFVVINMFGLGGGVLLDWITRGYERRSRGGAVVGVVWGLLLGWYLLYRLQELSFDIRPGWVLVWMFSCPICAGTLGVMFGAITDRIMQRSPARSQFGT
ncbi:MAG: hypothetical protein QGH60_02935 [Phycisphaerae bacterium]|jgi:hypothetical protein|nr:hypothetical protein [Phycisphaerae bacterium]